MLKTRIVPAHEESYKVCDFCGEEINDYSYAVYTPKMFGEVKDFHDMHAGGAKGEVDKTCMQLYDEQERQQYLKVTNGKN